MNASYPELLSENWEGYPVILLIIGNQLINTHWLAFALLYMLKNYNCFLNFILNEFIFLFNGKSYGMKDTDHT